jgi:ribosomal protein L6P/L9E
MSRIGRVPVKVPSKVTVTVDQDIIVKGPKGELSMPLFTMVK